MTGGRENEGTVWQLRSRAVDLTHGVLMGVVNVTPDSFSDGGVNLDPDQAVRSSLALHRAGAQIIDVGGESTRPGSDPVPVEVELARAIPVVASLASEGLIVSIDTSKPKVAEAAIEAGAQIVNDVTAGSADGMPGIVADSGVGVVLMHSLGEPKTMQADPRYEDVVAEVKTYLAERTLVFGDAGVAESAIVVDPGIGFGKTITHNLELIANLGTLSELGHPILLGASRKSFLGAITGIDSPAARDGVSAVITALGFERGARIFRVHDVESSRVALSVAAAIVAPQQWDEWSQA